MKVLVFMPFIDIGTLVSLITFTPPAPLKSAEDTVLATPSKASNATCMTMEVPVWPLFTGVYILLSLFPCWRFHAYNE